MYEENEGEEISFPSIYANYKDNGGVLPRTTVGKHIQFLFPKVTTFKAWIRMDQTELCMYKGLCEKKQNPEAEISEFSSISLWVPPPYFIFKKDLCQIHFGLFCHIVNGNYIVKRITFNSNGECQLFVEEKEIDLKEIGIDNTFKFTRNSIKDICFLVSKITLCKGKEKNGNSRITKGVVTEFLQDEKGGEEKEILRSKTCKRIVPFTATSTTCKTCQSVRQFIEQDDSDDDTIEKKQCLKKFFPEATDEMIDMLILQNKNLERNPLGRRWDDKTMNLCLSLWCRSKKNYRELRDSVSKAEPFELDVVKHKQRVHGFYGTPTQGHTSTLGNMKMMTEIKRRFIYQAFDNIFV